MREFDGARRIYEAAPVPEELGDVVNAAIREGKRRQGKVVKMRKKWSGWKAAACLLGVVLAGGTVAVNTSEAAAAALGDLPVIGGLARILTIREYSYQDEDMEIKAKIPAIVAEEENQGNGGNEAQGSNGQMSGGQGISGENGTASSIDGNYVEKVNQMIASTVEEYTQQAREHTEEYKKAFLDTGGTEEEFAQKDIKVDVTYDIKYQNDAAVSFVLIANESWNAAYGVEYFYNLNLADGREITLKELLGDDYINIANTQILEQMKSRTAEDPDYTYWGSDMDGFTTITDDSNFYINEAGNPVIVFAKYEIAPGFMGPQEFEISR